MMLLSLGVALAQEAAEPPPSLSFAAELSAMGQAEAAWLEYERAAFLLGPGDAADRARFAGCAALAQREEAQGCWKHAAALAQPHNAPLFRFELAELRYQRGEYSAAQAMLQVAPSPELADASAYREAWILLRTAGGEPARERLASVPSGAPLSAAALDFSAELAEDPQLPTRSPALAGAMSAALPGLGQLYAGEARDGASALLTNGLLIGGTAALAARKNWTGTAVVGTLALGFYAGNIFSAVNSAHRRNHRLQEAWLDELASRHELRVDLAPGATEDPLLPELHVGAD